jgi:hypothetical protein
MCPRPVRAWVHTARPPGLSSANGAARNGAPKTARCNRLGAASSSGCASASPTPALPPRRGQPPPSLPARAALPPRARRPGLAATWAGACAAAACRGATAPAAHAPSPGRAAPERHPRGPTNRRRPPRHCTRCHGKLIPAASPPLAVLLGPITAFHPALHWRRAPGRAPRRAPGAPAPLSAPARSRPRAPRPHLPAFHRTRRRGLGRSCLLRTSQGAGPPPGARLGWRPPRARPSPGPPPPPRGPALCARASPVTACPRLLCRGNQPLRVRSPRGTRGRGPRQRQGRRRRPWAAAVGGGRGRQPWAAAVGGGGGSARRRVARAAAAVLPRPAPRPRPPSDPCSILTCRNAANQPRKRVARDLWQVKVVVARPAARGQAGPGSPRSDGQRARRLRHGGGHGRQGHEALGRRRGRRAARAGCQRGRRAAIGRQARRGQPRAGGRQVQDLQQGRGPSGRRQGAQGLSGGAAQHAA